MKRTPLYDNHLAAGARMVPFGGWEMPVQYEGIIDEHHHTRNAVSVFDICHMGELMLKGAGAGEFLGRMITSSVQTIDIGRCKYGLMLNDSGGIIDDLIVYCLDENEYMVVVNAATTDTDVAWLKEHCPAGLTLENVSDKTAKLDIQGPDSPVAVAKLCGEDVSDLKYFGWKRIQVAGVDVLISRTGYTGCRGYELYCDSGSASKLWNATLAAGVKPAGLGARDTLRLEAGLPLSGQDIGPGDNPVQANMLRFVQMDKGFTGKDSLPGREGIDRLLVGFEIEGRRSARHENKVFDGDREIGCVTSGSFGPTLGKSIGMAYVDPARADEGAVFQIDTGRIRLDAKVVKMPFYNQ